MKTVTAVTTFLLVVQLCIAQTHDFDFGKPVTSDLQMTSYAKDTAAVAVVLNEVGEAYIDNDNEHHLIFVYHAKIKVLKKGGLIYADFEIPLRKGERYSEILRSVQASSFNLESGQIRESKLSLKNVFTEDRGKYRDYKKFAVPNVRVGSVIEVLYTLESPFIHNFRQWDFQAEIPKIKSDYYALMPANYHYSVALKGYLPLTKNESKLVKDCFTPFGTAKADCTELFCSMENVPAFKEEEYMTASSNFISSVNFELVEIKYFDGRTDKLSKEWKDVELELRNDPKFGVQLKRGGDIVDKQIELTLAGATDPLVKAQKVYDFIKGWYRWNQVYGEYSEFGIKKAFDKKTGNVGDINLSLIAALRYAGLSVEPILLSTRQNGNLTELYPVLSEFNYVIAKLNINDKVYLLDATEPFMPFGLIPERCLNGKGRALGEKGSYWYELNAPARRKQITAHRLKIGENGMITGTIKNTYGGYEALKERQRILSHTDTSEYIKNLESRHDGLSITAHKIDGLENIEGQLVVELTIELESFTGLDNYLFNPFFLERWEKNPFKSSERSYPVDFGVPMEEVVNLVLEYPPNYGVSELPQKIGLQLPNSGGRFLFQVQDQQNSLVVNSLVVINKPVFSADEYHYLRELFGRIVAAQQTQLVFKKKT